MRHPSGANKPNANISPNMPMPAAVVADSPFSPSVIAATTTIVIANATEYPINAPTITDALIRS